MKENRIEKRKEFKRWKKDYQKVYSKKFLSVDLYAFHSIVYLIAHYFISKFILSGNNSKNHLKPNETPQFEDNKVFKNIEKKFTQTFSNVSLSDLDYFNPFLNILHEENLIDFHDLLRDLFLNLTDLKISPEFYFDFFIQTFLPNFIRHKSGEFFTPSFLVKEMVKKTYKFGEKVLDPCCGTGNFLIGIIKTIINSDKEDSEKIKALRNIYGMDINPISVLIAQINVLYLLKDYKYLKINIFQADSLFNFKILPNKLFDLVIGNPPWYTYRDMEKKSYQEKIKNLANQLGIKPRPKNILNIEISSLFFYHAKEEFLKMNGKIFFVITKGVINGSHAARFRNFKGFNNLRIWTFSNDLLKIFNVDFICLFAKKGNKKKNLCYEIPTFHYEIKSNTDKIGYFEDLELTHTEGPKLRPYHVEKHGKKKYVKKLISEEKFKTIIPNQESEYKDLFHKGADLNPRNLIFLTYETFNDSLVKINPDPRVFKRAKRPWTKKEFENEIVEKKYIFNVIKSTELVKFFVYGSYKVFLPLSSKDLSYNYTQLEENAKNFYDKVNKIYLKYKKSTTKHNSLLENLDRWSKLSNDRQLSNLKVVYNNSGSILNAAVIQGDFLITGDLSFYTPKSLVEAYYLSAVLNSDLLTEQIKIRKSSRHIFKLPFSIPIKMFDEKNLTHLKLADLGKKAESIVKGEIKKIKENRDHFPSKYRIQKELSNKIKKTQKQINQLLVDDL